MRGKALHILPHAEEGMSAERPPIAIANIERVLEEPDYDDGKKAYRWIGHRTVIVYYAERPAYLRVRAVSATRRRLPA